MKKGFSLLEILITITLLVILAVLLILIFNPKGQINKAFDGKRKSELSTFKKVLEDWYNDKQCYPKPSEVCYDAPVNDTCHICGTAAGSPSLVPYLPTVICDPNHPTVKYLYNYDNADCPTVYRIFTVLSVASDPVISEVGCANGCGPSLGNNLSYNYGISSPNTGLVVQSQTPTETPTPVPTTFGVCSSFPEVYYIPDVTDGVCNICGSYAECKPAFPNKTFYSDTLCTKPCLKD